VEKVVYFLNYQTKKINGDIAYFIKNKEVNIKLVVNFFGGTKRINE